MKRHQNENVVVLIFTVILIYFLTTYLPFNSHHYVGELIILLGLTFWWVGKITMGEYFTVKSKARELVTTGIFSKIRHPCYLGFSLLIIGLAVFLWSWIMVIVAVIGVIIVVGRGYRENKALAQRYKKRYQKYKEKTWF